MEFLGVLEKMGIDPEETIRRFCQNEELLKKYLIKFSGEETFAKLDKSVASKDFEGILEHAHTLKGLSANLGMKNLNQYSSQLVDNMRAERHDDCDEIFEKAKAEYERLVEQIKYLE